MKIVIIGSGLIGLTTAYFLRRRGHEITVVDRQEGPGRETSFANGALLTPGMPEPWNAPGCWRVLLGSLGRSDSPLQLRLRTLPSLMGWGVKFLRNSREAAYRRNTLSNLRLALHSLKVMRSLAQETGVEFGNSARGSLKVFRSSAAFERASTAARRWSSEDLSVRGLSRDETIALEPALRPVAGQLIGSLHYLTDETGDAFRFCTGLAAHVRQLGIEFCFSTEVLSLEARSGRVTGVVSRAKRWSADCYVIAAGSYSEGLLRSVGVRVPVRPAKGYSVTFEGLEHDPPLTIPVIDDELHAAVVPLQGAVRVAGMAEFAGFDRTMDPARINHLVRLLKALLPEAQYEAGRVKPWCGLRSMCADGVPIIGGTRIPNLWVNTGHGHLGWTMAAGSGQLMAELLCGESPAIDSSAYSLARFP